MDEQFQSIDGCYIMSILDKKRPKKNFGPIPMATFTKFI